MRGSAPVGSCGQGVPRVNREVQARVVLDAIVSNKTFGNATLGQFLLHNSQIPTVANSLFLSNSLEKAIVLHKPRFFKLSESIVGHYFYTVRSQNGRNLPRMGTLRLFCWP